jgi:hypothetical protein
MEVESQKGVFISCPQSWWTYTCKIIFFLLFVHHMSTTDQIKPNEAQFHLVKINEPHHHKTASEQHSEGTVRVFW